MLCVRDEQTDQMRHMPGARVGRENARVLAAAHKVETFLIALFEMEM